MNAETQPAGWRGAFIAMLRAPFRYPAWHDTAQVLLACPIAIVAGTVVLTLTLTTAALAITAVLAIPFLIALFACSRTFSGWQRSRLQGFSTTPLPPLPKPAQAPTWWRRLWLNLRTPNVWRQVGYQCLSLITASLTTLAGAARIDHRTANAYLDLLEDLRIIERLPAWTANRFNRMVKTPKYHIIDTGLAAHLAGDTRTGILKSGDRIGRLIDTFVLAQLRPLLRLATPAVTAHHVRDGNQTREIDLLLESAAGQIVGIEIKAASTLELRDARHLAWLRDHIGDTFHRGIVLHTGATSYPLGERIWALPIASLWQ